MSMRVNDIFRQKLEEIQSRVPIKINILENLSFDSVLNETQNKTNSLTRDNLQYKPSSIGFSPTKGQTLQAIEASISNAAKKYDVNPNLVRAIVRQESSFNPNSLSSAGAQGLMQLMPGTARSLGVSNPWDIEQNIEGGTHYIKEQIDQFGDVSMALAAYNAGPGAVQKYNGIPPYQETQNYVQKVLKYFNEYEGSNLK